MNNGWEYCYLEDVVTKGSSNISLNKIKEDCGDYPVFGAQGFVQEVSFYDQEDEYLAIIKDGAGIGRVSKHPAKSSVVATMQYLIPRKGFDIDFIKYFLEGIDFEKYRNGSTIPHIYFKDYKCEMVPKLPLPEQQRIVAILDEAFAAIAKAKANAEQNLKNAKELFDVVLDKILCSKKWNIKPLGEVCERVEYGTSSKAKAQGEMPVLRMGNIQKGRFVWDDLVYSNNEEDNSQYLLKHNDVLFNRTNSPELVGKTAIYKSERPAIFAGYLIRIHRDERLLDADYLNYYLNSKMAMDYGRSVVISSVNQANINGTKLKTYPIPLPSLKEQQSIVRQLDALRTETQRLEALYQKKITNLEDLKKSILQKAFAGELKTNKAMAVCE